MPRPKSVPSYRRHRQSGQAIVTLPDGTGGRSDVLLGKFGTAASRAEYARVIAEWEAAGRRLLSRSAVPSELTVNEVNLAYLRFAEGYYVKNGQPTSQLERVKRSLRFVRELYGRTLAKDFGPLALKAVRGKMIEADWARGHMNACIGCVKRAFKWAVEQELVAPSIYHGLQAVSGLKKGRCDAKEGRRVLPVADVVVTATLPYLTPPVQAMVRVQGLAGMRPGEVVLMRPCDIDRRPGKSCWIYRPESHKTEHHGIEKLIMLGPQAQALLAPFLLGKHPGHYLFAPREGMEDFRKRQREARKTKVQPSQQNRRKRRPRKQPGDRYTRCSFARAIAYGVKRVNRDRACDACKKLKPKERCDACKAAAVPHWDPHQLRHTKATEIRREAGLDAARAVLGHRSPAITEVYAEIDQSKAEEVMGRLG